MVRRIPSKRSAIGHVLGIIDALMVIVFVVAVLADGRSVAYLKPPDQLPFVTNPEIVNATLSFIAGNTYGVGLHHDNSGRTYGEVDARYGTLPQLLDALGPAAVLAALPTAIGEDVVKEPTEFLQCIQLQDTIKFALGIAFIGVSVAGLVLLLHALALGGLVASAPTKLLLIFLWGFLSLGFMLVIAAGYSVYYFTWSCDNPVIPTIKLADSFDLNYAIPCALIGEVGCILGVAFTSCGTDMSAVKVSDES